MSTQFQSHRRIMRRQISRQLDRVRRVPVKIHRPVTRNHRQPAAKRRGLPEAGEPVPRGEEDVLHEIVDIDPRHARQEEPVNHPRITLVELSERRLVSPLRRLRQPAVVGRMRRRKANRGHR